MSKQIKITTTVSPMKIDVNIISPTDIRLVYHSLDGQVYRKKFTSYDKLFDYLEREVLCMRLRFGTLFC